MLKKNSRADTKTVDKIFREGTSVSSPGLTLRFIKSQPDSSSRISFIAPKSIARSAVKRNALRRLGYSAYRKQILNFPKGINGVFIFRNSSASAATLAKDLDIILRKI